MTSSNDEYEFTPIAPVEECPPGERLFLSLDDQPVIVFNIAGRFFAIGDVCSHDGNLLDNAPLEGHEIVCPRHGARFDVRTGKVMGLPAVVDVPAYPVRVVVGKIKIGIPRE
jgi:3-phenylpropionate/trans-cinnamate dioxygenase ferredoxin subunit